MTAFDKYEHKATKTRPKFPFHEEEWKMPGWTGHKTDVGEVYGGTPFYQQLNTKAPIETSTLLAPKVHKEVNNATIFKDPANNSANWLREKPDNLFPSQVTKPAKPGNPPFISSLVFGDDRYARAVNGVTGYTSTYMEMCDSLEARKEGKIKMEAASGFPRLSEMTQKEVKFTYTENFKRVNREMVTALRESLRIRIAGKIKPGNNSNAHMLRQLFSEADKNKNKTVEIDEFQLLLESFGMQLKRSDAIALFSYYDKDANGRLDIEEFMGDMLDADYYALFSRTMESEADLSKAINEEEEEIVALIREKLANQTGQLRKVFRMVDSEKSGRISTQELKYGLRKLAIFDVTDAELTLIMAKTDKDGDGIDINEFVSRFGTFDANPLGDSHYVGRERSGLSYVDMGDRMENISKAYEVDGTAEAIRAKLEEQEIKDTAKWAEGQ